MMRGALRSGSLYWLTSVPQTPATSIFSSAASGGISGRSNSRSSIVDGPVFRAASDFAVAVMSGSILAFRPFDTVVRARFGEKIPLPTLRDKGGRRYDKRAHRETVRAQSRSGP